MRTITREYRIADEERFCFDLARGMSYATAYQNALPDEYKDVYTTHQRAKTADALLRRRPDLRQKVDYYRHKIVEGMLLSIPQLTAEMTTIALTERDAEKRKRMLMKIADLYIIDAKKTGIL